MKDIYWTLDIKTLRDYKLTASQILFLIFGARGHTTMASAYCGLDLSDFHYLMNQGWIRSLNGEITKQSIDLVRKLDIGLTESSVYEILNNADGFTDFTEEYRELFPKGIKSGGKLVRSDKVSVEKKLRKFVKENHFTKEDILKATNNYIEDKRKVGWQYMQTAANFIEKNQVSELAARCENLGEIMDEEKGRIEAV